MIKIDLQNIQAIGSASIEIADNSITEFSGDNSNGKSILSKVIQALTSGELSHKDVRRTLIKDGTDCGVVSFIKDNQQLGIILKEELSQSLVTYTDDHTDESKLIVRQLGDAGGVSALVRKFGFRTYNNGDICLQLSPTWGAIPFVTTSGAVNNDIVQDITVDKIAQQFLDSFKTITFPTFKQRLKNIKAEQEHVEQVLDAMESYDWKAYEALAQEMREVYNILDSYKFIEIDNIHVPEKLEVYDVYDCKLLDIKHVQLYTPAPYFEGIKALSNLISLKSGVCPTCGRSMAQ